MSTVWTFCLFLQYWLDPSKTLSEHKDLITSKNALFPLRWVQLPALPGDLEASDAWWRTHWKQQTLWITHCAVPYNHDYLNNRLAFILLKLPEHCQGGDSFPVSCANFISPVDLLVLALTGSVQCVFVCVSGLILVSSSSRASIHTLLWSQVLCWGSV